MKSSSFNEWFKNLDLTRKQKTHLAIVVVTNLMPVFGVIFFSWDAVSTIFFYWFENLIVGVFTLAKILIARGTKGVDAAGAKSIFAAKSVLSVFFVLHYGGFMFVHYKFLIEAFGPPKISMEQLMLCGFTLTLGYIHNLIFSYIGNKEYKTKRPDEFMATPYIRIVIIHVTVILSVFLVKFFGSPLIGLFILILLKIVADLFAHMFEFGKITMDELYEFLKSKEGKK